MPADRKTLQALLERVKEAKGGDRELDADLEAALMGGEVRWLATPYTMESVPAIWRANANYVGGFAREHVPNATGSIDAALALVERAEGIEWIELTGPRRYLNIPTPVPNYWRAEVRTVVGWGATAPLAILAALLTALLAQTEEVAA